MDGWKLLKIIFIFLALNLLSGDYDFTNKFDEKTSVWFSRLSKWYERLLLSPMIIVSVLSEFCIYIIGLKK